jgi:hypothetical protein
MRAYFHIDRISHDQGEFENIFYIFIYGAGPAGQLAMPQITHRQAQCSTSIVNQGAQKAIALFPQADR